MSFRLQKSIILAGFFCAFLIFSGCSKEDPLVFTDKFEDLGLSVKWGETESKSEFLQSNYKWMKDGWLTKYCTSQYLGEVDGKTVLDIEDDAASARLGKGWRMPTLDEFQELYDNCTWIWSELGGVRGFMIISNVPGYEDRYIFLPAAGYTPEDEVMSDNYFCYYWMSETDKDDNTPSARILRASVMNAGPGSSPRYFGIPIRPVHE